MTDGDKHVIINNIETELVKIYLKSKDDLMLQSLINEAISKILDVNSHIALKIEKEQKEWSVKNGI